jgi:hypothetical protein
VAGETVIVQSSEGERTHEYETTVPHAFDRRTTAIDPTETPCIIFGEGKCEVSYPGRDHEIARHKLEVIIECVAIETEDREDESAAPLIRRMMNDVTACLNTQRREFLRLDGAVESIKRVSDEINVENNQLIGSGVLRYEFSYLTPDDQL